MASGIPKTMLRRATEKEYPIAMIDPDSGDLVMSIDDNTVSNVKSQLEKETIPKKNEN